MKTLVIGVAGTGKSHIVREMKRRRLNAVDVDKGLTVFVDEGGKESEYDPDGGAKWWRSHYYVLKPGKLEKLLKRSVSIYVFGDVGGRRGKGNGLLDVAHLFDRVCYMRAPPWLIRERLARRTDNVFGKSPDEVEGTMRHKAKMDRIARKMRFEVVDASWPAEEIIRIVTGPGTQSRA